MRAEYDKVLLALGHTLTPEELDGLERLVARLQSGEFPSAEGDFESNMSPVVLRPSLDGWDASEEDLGEFALSTIGGCARATMWIHEQEPIDAPCLIPSQFVPLAQIDEGACQLHLGMVGERRAKLFLLPFDGNSQVIAEEDIGTPVGTLI